MLTLCVALLLLAQEPTGEEPALPPAAPADTPHSESAAARRVRMGVARSLEEPAEAPTTASETPAVPPTEEQKKPVLKRRGFAEQLTEYTDAGPLHYAFYYAPDYVSVLGMGALATGVQLFPPPTSRRAAWGPTYDPDRRNTGSVNAQENDRLLGAPYRKDTVPSWSIPVVGNAVLLGVGALSLTRHPSFRKIHHFVLGAFQTQLSSFILTELTKSALGRLRPDYRDRMAHYYCAPGREVPSGVDCSGISGGYITSSEFEEGRRSFPSGHAASSFAIAAYLALFLGGEMVWGEHATVLTRLPGVAAQLAVLTAATLVAATRISDGRHHPEDVVAGAGLGSAMAALFYFLHFDLQGHPIVRKVNLVPLSTGAGGFGMGFNGSLP